MKYFLVCLMIVVSMVSMSLPVFAGHDHGGDGSHGVSHEHSHDNDQASKTADQILKECSQHVDSIQRHIGRLQAQLVDGKAATNSMTGELEHLEHSLKEAKELARALRAF